MAAQLDPELQDQLDELEKELEVRFPHSPAFTRLARNTGCPLNRTTLRPPADELCASARPVADVCFLTAG
jgi:hypothetical protein